RSSPAPPIALHAGIVRAPCCPPRIAAASPSEPPCATDRYRTRDRLLQFPPGRVSSGRDNAPAGRPRRDDRQVRRGVQLPADPRESREDAFPRAGRSPNVAVGPARDVVARTWKLDK